MRLSAKPGLLTTMERKTPSALGERQMLPRQTNSTFTYRLHAIIAAPLLSASHDLPDPLQILFGIHAARVALPARHFHVDAGAIVECPQLFQGFSDFGRGWRPGHEIPQEADAVAVDADVPDSN